MPWSDLKLPTGIRTNKELRCGGDRRRPEGEWVKWPRSRSLFPAPRRSFCCSDPGHRDHHSVLQEVKEMESAVERLTDEQKQLLTALALLEEQLSQTRLELQTAHVAQKDMDPSMQALESRLQKQRCCSIQTN
ncbi:uncharacterized protein LOC129694866 isoform X1 [Leucoraja erinacea]|uniref:uncharacterized protein LOC129694866 isoform X1 n=1 Tax=Leucoraja erinaceus TaxID=7782 RepID=UPI002456E01A|nr:uncharacterized protein LOC129694866 isoform X1 [Leucoraja erinacea]